MKSLTFADTLHPETADIYVDPNNGSTSVWGTVMNEICTDLPIAVVIQDEDVSPGTVTRIPDEKRQDDINMPSGVGCFYLEGFLGCCLTFTAMAATFAVELVAAICYCLAAGFYFIVRIKECPIFIKAIVMVIVHALMVVDAILLTVSVMLTEVLGAVTGLITCIFNSRCCLVGKAWHIYVRKICHLTRWAFRNFHEGWALKRTFSNLEFDVAEEVDCDNEASPVKAEAVLVAHSIENSNSNNDPIRAKEARKMDEYQV